MKSLWESVGNAQGMHNIIITYFLHFVKYLFCTNFRSKKCGFCFFAGLPEIPPVFFSVFFYILQEQNIAFSYVNIL